MGYKTGESNILNILRGMSAWNASNTARGNWAVLNSGNSQHYAILKPGGFINETISLGNKTQVTTWVTNVEVWNRLTATDVGGDLEDITELVTDILTEIQKYPFLSGGEGGNIMGSRITLGDEPIHKWGEGSANMWLFWEIRIEWDENRQVTILE